MTQWPQAADEIVVKDGHLTINLYKLSDGWSARIESAYEGRVFEGRVTEMSDLLAGPPVPSASAADSEASGADGMTAREGSAQGDGEAAREGSA